ncbi:hypothetical protein CLV63_110208 [Murinocardiopsis flavida]|uniref:HTH domain-containing protein n=1 Tax=Murinocardiopsis flavida TaxID=645275 RepID=A0A2P8DI82_9ACTN|nr:hypothetical protein [Murinocardiopsis flavida]PSK96908.1 hypothetical protein CLV63_110208 [Murinocardiopsis flavida]
MSVTVGVVGPEDLVARVLTVADSLPGTRLVALPYPHVDLAPEVARDGQADTDALLFTGVIAYTRASNAGVLRRPAGYVSYSGATLLRALVELLRLGHDVTRISIDTLARDQVVDTLTEARLPTGHVRVLPYDASLSSEDIVRFHREAREHDGTEVAVTCLGSAFAALDPVLPAVRLTPSRHSIAAALRSLVLTASGRHIGDAQVAIGLIDVPGEPPESELALLGAAAATRDDGVRMLVTTRGLLEHHTAGFTRLPLLGGLSARHPAAHAGFGVGRTAAEAESRARHALNRAAHVGRHAAVVTLNEEVDVVLAGANPPAAEPSAAADPPRGTDDIPLLAHRVGLRRETLTRLHALSGVRSGEGITALDVADHLGVQQRTARRILKRMEHAGLAVPLGGRQEGRTGRPPVAYLLQM